MSELNIIKKLSEIAEPEYIDKSSGDLILGNVLTTDKINNVLQLIENTDDYNQLIKIRNEIYSVISDIEDKYNDANKYSEDIVNIDNQTQSCLTNLKNKINNKIKLIVSEKFLMLMSENSEFKELPDDIIYKINDLQEKSKIEKNNKRKSEKSRKSRKTNKRRNKEEQEEELKEEINYMNLNNLNFGYHFHVFNFIDI